MSQTLGDDQAREENQTSQGDPAARQGWETRPPAAKSAARTRAEAWLAEFEAALTARDPDRAAALFATTSFWRDLVAFTWNLKTVEDLSLIHI